MKFLIANVCVFLTLIRINRKVTNLINEVNFNQVTGNKLKLKKRQDLFDNI